MSLFIKQDETRTRLQQQIAAELQDKARKKAEEAELPDGVDDSRFIEKTNLTGRRDWIWIIIVVVVVAVAIFLVFRSAK